MSELILAVVGAALLMTNLYWWRRHRIERTALNRSETRDERVSGRIETTPETTAVLRDAADRADCTPDELPKRVNALRDRIRECERDLKRVRTVWSHSWWDALAREQVSLEEPHALCIALPDATIEDVQQFAAHAQNYENEIAIISALEEGTVAVSVGAALTAEFSAADILDDILDETGGNGGGSDEFATGGGADSEQLPETTEKVRETLVERL